MAEHSIAPRRRGSAARAYHHGDLRQALLERAIVVIGERGHLDFTLRELARDLGVSHAAPYRHFADKAALVTALAVEASGALGARIEAALAGAGRALRARFLAAGRAYVGFALDRPAEFAALFSPEVDALDPVVVASKARMFGVLLAFIAEAQAAGAFAKGPPEALAATIWAMHQGLAVLAVSGAFDADRRRRSPAQAPELWRAVDAANVALLDGLVQRRRAPPRAKPALGFAPSFVKRR
ncbi:MAG TPA: TetR/AcrR family transcriptional regulator [Byssovorax sp.]